MQLLIYCFIALVVVGAADPKPRPALSSSLAPVKKFSKRLERPELTLYLTRDIIKALQADELSKVSASQPPGAEKSKKKNRGFVSRFFLPKDKEVIENQEKNNLANYYLESLKDKNKYRHLQNSHQNNAYNEQSQSQANINSVPYIPVSYKNQEEILRLQQLKQQWKSILDRNPAQLQSFSASNQQNDLESLIQINDNNIQQQALKTEYQKSEVDQEIENILRNDPAFSSAPSNSPNQHPPILIHKEVTITKHLPVPIYKGPEVSEPESGWVPIPDPYMVRVPQPYPFPEHMVKHFPVPLIRNY